MPASPSPNTGNTAVDTPATRSTGRPAAVEMRRVRRGDAVSCSASVSAPVVPVVMTARCRSPPRESVRTARRSVTAMCRWRSTSAEGASGGTSSGAGDGGGPLHRAGGLVGDGAGLVRGGAEAGEALQTGPAVGGGGEEGLDLLEAGQVVAGQVTAGEGLTLSDQGGTDLLERVEGETVEVVGGSDGRDVERWHGGLLSGGRRAPAGGAPRRTAGTGRRCAHRRASRRRRRGTRRRRPRGARPRCVRSGAAGRGRPGRGGP
jgi:hypothetical protein